MSGRRGNADQPRPEILADKQMGVLLEQFILAQNMTQVELLDCIRREDPNAPLIPPAIDGVAITISGSRAIARWAEIVRDATPHIKKKVSADAWLKMACASFIEAVHEVRRDNTGSGDAVPWFNARVKELAEGRVDEKKPEITHYIPCYLFRDTVQKEFSVGRVSFYGGVNLFDRIQGLLCTTPKWRDDYFALKSIRESSQNDAASKASPDFRASIVNRASQSPWIAEIRIDALEPGMARKRAEDVVRLTLAGVGLCVPASHCANIHLVSEATRAARVDWISQISKQDIATVTHSYLPQVGGHPKWTETLLELEADYLKWLGEAIESVMLADATNAWTDLRTQWLNALYWYHIGCVEPSDARAAICFSSALESLSNGDGADAILEMCQSILGVRPSEIAVESHAKTWRQSIVEIYRSTRSEIVHGGRFVLLQEVTTQRALSVQIAQFAISEYQRLLASYESEKPYDAILDRRDIFLKWSKAKKAIPE